MLNWDEYEESSTAPKPQQKAQQPVTETVSEEPQSQENEMNYAAVESGDRAKQAKEAIQGLDTKAGEEELEVLAGRVQVDDKAMIN